MSEALEAEINQIECQMNLSQICLCYLPLGAKIFSHTCIIVLQQSLNKSLSFRDGPTGGTSFVNIYQNVRLDP